MGLDLGGLLQQLEEKFAARSRGAAVKAKSELVQLVVQMAALDGSLVRAQEPAKGLDAHAATPLRHFLAARALRCWSG